MSVDVAPAQYTDYYRLMAEYRDCVGECRASLDRLHRMERGLREIAATLPFEQRLDAAGEIEKTLERLDGNSAPAIHNLSARKAEVFRLLGDGLATQEIAQRLSVTFHSALSFVAML